MKINYFYTMSLIALLSVFSLADAAQTNIKDSAPLNEAYQLFYIEREPGLDDYEVSMLVSDRYIRIDEAGENSGFIVYDDKVKTIYSVSHADESVLVIKEHKFNEDDSPARANVEYLQLADAPTVSGQDIYNYRIFVNQGKDDTEDEMTCTEVQLVENLLPEVRKMLRNYQTVVAGQQVKMIDNKITEIQTPCFYADQIYNTGAYYEKGLPIQEWHSNERSKILKTYKKVPVTADKFVIPEAYRQFSVDKNSKTSID